MNFVCITKDTPASVQIYVADETISTVSELETGLAGHQYIIQVGNQVWDKTFAHGYTKTTSSWEAVAGGGSGGGAEIFIVTPNTTTYAQIVAAHTAGKLCIARYENDEYYLTRINNTGVKFSRCDVDNSGNYTYEWNCSSSNSWTSTYGYPSVYVATYGSTSYQAIYDALYAGQSVICHRLVGDSVETFHLVYQCDNDISFMYVDQNMYNEFFTKTVKIGSNNQWTTYDLMTHCELQAGNGITIQKQLVNGKYKNVISLNLPTIQGTDTF